MSLSKDVITIVVKFLDFDGLRSFRLVCRQWNTISTDHFNKKIDWVKMSWKQDPPDHFMRKYQNLLEWDIVSSKEGLTEEFIEEFRDLVNWELISQKQKLSMRFIRKFKDRVNWYWVSSQQRISTNFIIEFADRLDLGRIRLRNDILCSETDISFLRIIKQIVKLKKMAELDVRFDAIRNAVDDAAVNDLFESTEHGAMATTIHGKLYIYTHFNDRSMVLLNKASGRGYEHRISYRECSVVDILTTAFAQKFPCRCEVCKSGVK